MNNPLVIGLRSFLAEVNDQLGTVTDDLTPFLHENGRTFRRRPELPSIPENISVTTTCTCLMALASTGKFHELFGKESAQNVREAFDLIIKSPWKSSGLPRDNSFTTSIVIRAMGFLIDAKVLPISFQEKTTHTDIRGKTRSLAAIAQRLADNAPDSFRIQKGRLPSSTAAYWFVDGVSKSRISIALRSWKKLFLWADKNLMDHVAHVLTEDISTMDPVEMAMSMSLCSRLKTMAARCECGMSPDLLNHLSSNVLFEQAINLLFKRQDHSGLWNKYFELFSYMDECGSNYCFTFEMLEAVLHEFGSNLLNLHSTITDNLRRAFLWCKQHRKIRIHNGKEYQGWNSAGLVSARDVPESWATAVAHMFLQELSEHLSTQLQCLHLAHYAARIETQGSTAWKQLLPIPLWSPCATCNTVQDLLAKEVASPAEAHTPSSIRKVRLNRARFVLLFGPPGTCKTELVRAFARKLGWPLVELNPSHFLAENQSKVFANISEVFLDLNDLAGVVIFFDEFDGFVQERQDTSGDLTSRMLTTTMLTQLGNLRSRGQVIFFAATNHREKVDIAVKRLGRFDVQVCMSPPTWSDVLDHIPQFVENASSIDLDSIKNIYKEMSQKLTKDHRELLELFTYGEKKMLFKLLSLNAGSKETRIADLDITDFVAVIEKVASQMTLAPGTQVHTEYIQDREVSKVA